MLERYLAMLEIGFSDYSAWVLSREKVNARDYLLASYLYDSWYWTF